MDKFLMIFSINLFSLTSVVGQEVYRNIPKPNFYILSTENIGNNHAGDLLLNKWDTLDICQICVIHDVHIIGDTLQPTVRKMDRMITQIGSHWIKSYGQTQWRVNQNRTLYDAGKDQIAYPDLQDLVIDFTIYRNRITDTLINHQTLPFLENRAIIYYEPKPSMAWNLTSDVKNIAGYACHRATTRFRGRDWTVWFTPEIPVDCGLWKFNGLPGLILEAADSRKHYHFLVHEIAEANKAILFYKVPATFTNRIKWMKMAQKAYRQPVEFYKKKVCFYFVNPETMDMSLLDDTWNIPYNPIELE